MAASDARAGRPFALSSLPLRLKQGKGPRNIGFRNEKFQAVQQIESSQQGHEIAQCDGAGFFEALKGGQAHTASMGQVHLRKSGAFG